MEILIQRAAGEESYLKCIVDLPLSQATCLITFQLREYHTCFRS